jgi:hypothetical protein
MQRTAARARTSLHMLHTQNLTKSPQTVPLNASAANQNMLVGRLLPMHETR